MVEPFHQDSFSGLCGVYSILNAYKIVFKANEDDTQFLFNEIVEYLSKKRLLKHSILNGMGFKEVNMVMRDVVYNYMPHYKISWMGYPNPTLGGFWKSIRNHLTKPNNCIILGVSGLQDHWSTGISATDKTITLVDFEWKYLKRKSCSTTELNENIYALYPAQTFYISNEEF